MKNKNKDTKEKKPYIKTKTRLDGGKEIEITKSPSKTWVGKFFAFLLAFITLFGMVFMLIYLLINMK